MTGFNSTRLTPSCDLSGLNIWSSPENKDLINLNMNEFHGEIEFLGEDFYGRYYKVTIGDISIYHVPDFEDLEELRDTARYLRALSRTEIVFGADERDLFQITNINPRRSNGQIFRDCCTVLKCVRFLQEYLALIE